jgi:Transposase
MQGDTGGPRNFHRSRSTRIPSKCPRPGARPGSAPARCWRQRGWTIPARDAGVPRPLVEIAKLGRTLSKRAADVLAYFDRPGTSNGPTEAINGRLEHLRGSALGFRNLTNYIARSLAETGGFRPRLHPALVKSGSSWGSAKDPTETGNQILS